MTQHHSINRTRRGISRALLTIAGLLAATVVLAPAASAATDCYPNSDGSGERIVVIDDAQGDNVVLEMRNGILFVDGVSCGTPSGQGGIAQVFIADAVLAGEGATKVDRVTINLAAGPWQVGGEPVFVNMRLEGGPGGVSDQLTIRGRNGSDDLVTRGNIVRVYEEFGAAGQPEKLFINTSSNCRRGNGRSVGCVKYVFNLRGGSDSYQNFPLGGVWFNGRDVVVKGGRGNDYLGGTPVRDRLNGGGGNDEIRGEGGNDILHGNAGRDLMKGGAGNDLFLAQDGTDRVRGGAGSDECQCDGRDNVRKASRV